MEGDVYVVAGGKGGVGKTTTVINTGVALQEAGHETVVVDADLGMTNLAELLAIDNEPTLHDVLAGDAELSEALVDGPGGVSVLAGQASLEAFAYADPSQLRPVLHSLARSFDVVLVDTGAGLTRETIVPASVADGIVLVTSPKDVSVVDAGKMADLAERIDGEIVGTVVTKARKETDVAALEDDLGEDVLAVVPWAGEATEHEPIVLTAADSYAAQAYRTLASKLVDEVDTQKRDVTYS